MNEMKNGRPPKYTETQVLKGIDIVERAGAVPNGDTVKKAICTRLGVAGGINAQSLDKEVHRLLEERGRQRRNMLIASLPPETLDAAKEIGALVEAAVLGHIGEQHHDLRHVAGKKLAVLNIDLGNQREQIRELLSRIDEKDGEIAGLEEEKHNLEGHLNIASSEILALKERIASLESKEDLGVRMLTMMKETLSQHSNLNP